jgi:hypothetical protein
MSSAVPPGVSDRLAEKTVELNFARQVGPGFPTAFWFGLTQAQEAQNGYDAAFNSNGVMFLFQFKVSTTLRLGGVRQFRAAHHQLAALSAQVAPRRRVFYVLPDVGTVPEIATSAWDILSRSWLLDVADIPNPLERPITRSGSIRRSNTHYLDLTTARGPAHVTIHSEPAHAPLARPSVVFGEDIPAAVAAAPRNDVDPIFANFWSIRALLTRAAVGVVVPRSSP